MIGMTGFDKRPKKFKFSNDSRIPSIRKREAGSINVASPVCWPAFLEDARAEVKSVKEKSPAWKVVPRSVRLVGNYLNNLKVSWVVALLTEFIQYSILRSYKKTSPMRFKLVANLSVTEESNSNEAILQQLQGLQKFPYEPLSAFVFLFTFVDRGGNEAVITLFVEDDKIEVFVPFPAAWAGSPLMRDIVCRTVKILAKDWMKIRIDTRKGCDSIGSILVYKTPKNFPDSNVWNLQFLLMRMQLSATDVQAVLAEPSTIGDLHDRAIFAFQHVGKLMSKCIFKVAQKGDRVAQEAYEMYFSDTARKASSLDPIKYQQLIKIFKACQLNDQENFKIFNPDSLLSVSPSVAWSEAEATSEQWSRFAQVPGSVDPWFIFVPKKYASVPEVSVGKKKQLVKKKDDSSEQEEEEEEEFFV